MYVAQLITHISVTLSSPLKVPGGKELTLFWLRKLKGMDEREVVRWGGTDWDRRADRTVDQKHTDAHKHVHTHIHALNNISAFIE